MAKQLARILLRARFSWRVQIIRAHSPDAPTLSAIAWAAKAHWGYPAHWMEQWRDQLTITPEFIAANETFVAVINGRMIAFHALLETVETLCLEHLWVLPEQIGQGIGRILFTHASEIDGRCRELPLLTFDLTEIGLRL